MLYIMGKDMAEDASPVSAETIFRQRSLAIVLDCVPCSTSKDVRRVMS